MLLNRAPSQSGHSVGGRLAKVLAFGTARAAVTEVAAFGPNPGALRMLVYAPPDLEPGRPLIVVLHGCGQDAATFAAEAGWLTLARQARVALLLPEQRADNNRGRCFNWFRPEDVRPHLPGCDGGEAASIRQMVRHAIGRFHSDQHQVFVMGFSAGGGMAAALLAAYPGVFAAGGVVAGMPVGSATTPAAAMTRMRRAETAPAPAVLAAAVRAMAPPNYYWRSWPRLSVWHGERDRTVDPGNAEILAAQWSELHGSGPAPVTDEIVRGVRRRVWSRPAWLWPMPARPPVLEVWTMASIGHGFPVDARDPDGGSEGAWVVDAGVSAVHFMTAFWGLRPPKG